MSEYCDFLVTDWDKEQIIAGRIVLENGELKSYPNIGHENTMKAVRNAKSYTKNKEFDADEDPRGWLRSLPYHSIVEASSGLVWGKTMPNTLDARRLDQTRGAMLIRIDCFSETVGSGEFALIV